MLPAPSAVPDIRTGCPQFWKDKSGAHTGCLSSLEEYLEQLKDMETFVLDCSFSLEEALEKAELSGRDPARHSHAGTYRMPHWLLPA